MTHKVEQPRGVAMLRVRLAARQIRVTKIGANGLHMPSDLDLYEVTCVLEQAADRRWHATIRVAGAPLTGRFREGKTYPVDTINTPTKNDLAGAKERVRELVLEHARDHHSLPLDADIITTNYNWCDGSEVRL